MPLYTFYDSVADEVFESLMSIATMEMFVKENPHIQKIIDAPAIVSGVMGVGQLKTDSGFKDLLNKISVANPGSNLAAEHGDKGIKATKNRQILDRQRLRQFKSSL